MEVLHEILHETAHAVAETAKAIPFLFITYLLMELIEHKWEEKAQRIISSHGAGVLGPVAGSALGIIPQCGFSAAAAGLFAGGVIPIGTLIAVFLSTSDEMLPIMISKGASVKEILPILAAKLLTGMIVGTALNFIFRKKKRSDSPSHEIGHLCE